MTPAPYTLSHMPSQQQISELYDLYTAHPAVTTDSRHIPEGAIFFALRGPSFDGNAFAAEALRKGAALAVVDDPEAIPSGTNPGRDYFLVDNVLQTLQELAAMHRTRLGIPILAITGTNGKTTTTALAAHILNVCGKKAQAVGNIGDTCIDAVASGAVDCYVAEVSSYQLASTKLFKPEVAVLLNITPDHLKWHGSFEAYAEAKRKIYANCDENCTVVLDATNDVVRGYVRELKKQPASERKFSYIPLGTCHGLNESMREDACGSDAAAFLDNGVLTIDFKGVKHALCAASELQIKGEHNASNALASASCAVALGCDDAKIVEGLKSFAPLEHRIEPCSSIAGVQCYNDSKATNVDATLKALAAFGEQRPIVLLGGCDKGTDLADLVAGAEKHCKAVVCFGAAGARFLKAFEGAKLPVYSAGNLESALDEALSHAEAGDIVTLSPACSSFDEFSCFEERGDVFKKLVADRSAERGA